MANLEMAIALGKGRGTKEVYFYDTGLLFFDKNGNRMEVTQDDKGNVVDPRTLPTYDHTEAIPMQAGRLQYMPLHDPETLTALIANEEFARPAFQDQITGWIKDGLESYDLIAKVKEAGGLVTYSDFGLTDPNADGVVTGKGKKKGA